MKLSVLTDDKVRKPGFLAEHGLSLFLELEQKRLLFDTGQTDVYCRNAEKMGVDLKTADYVMLSHSHYDHCGGLPFFPKGENTPRIYVRESAFARHYVESPDGKSFREIGIPWSPEEQDKIRENLVFADDMMQIEPGIFLCGGIPMDESAKQAAAHFFIASGSDLAPDPMQDEQMLVVERGDGLSVFLGCSHPGIVNCLDYVQKQFPGKQIAVLAAGMHLEGAEPQQLECIISHFLELKIQKVIPLHCTGLIAISEMKRRLGDRCRILYVGDTIEL